MDKSREFAFKGKLENISHYENLMAFGMKISKKALTEWANVKFDTSIPHMTIGRLLKKKTLLTTFDVGHMVDSKHIRRCNVLKWSKVLSTGLQQCKRRAPPYPMINWWLQHIDSILCNLKILLRRNSNSHMDG